VSKVLGVIIISFLVKDYHLVEHMLQVGRLASSGYP
jgi:hypothetical protein